MTVSSLFADDQVPLDLLRERAYLQRWAVVPPDVIPLTAADPDFPVAPEIAQAIQEYAEPKILHTSVAGQFMPRFKVQLCFGGCKSSIFL